MKRLCFVALPVLLGLLTPQGANAQTTATGTLTVSAVVNSSISVVFNSDPSGVALGGSGTAAATLTFGNVQAFGGTLAPGVVRTNGTDNFTVTSGVDVLVKKSNSNSPKYTLTAQLSTNDSTNTWTVGGVTVTSGSPAQISANGLYSSNVNFPVGITIPNSENAGTINNVINYTATAN